MILAYFLLAEQANADTWLDLVARFMDQLPAMLTALAGVVTAIVIAKRGAARYDAAAADLAAVRDSVVNDHDRPMRYDLDDVAAALIALRGDIADVGTKVDEEAATRRSADAATNRKVDAAIAWAKAVTAEHHPESMHNAPGGDSSA